MNRFKIAAATAGVAAVSTLVPLGIGGVAHADTSANGCTVKPYAPTSVQSGELGSHGRRMAKYKVDVTCVAGLDIVIDQDFWEQDLDWREGPAAADDEYFGSEITNLSFSVAGTQSFTTRWELPSTGPVENGTEEVYQAVQFQVVVPLNGEYLPFPWTAYELTQATELTK
jgi:hypothetical protein